MVNTSYMENMTYKGEQQECIIDQCKGCERIGIIRWRETGARVRVCTTYWSPRAWWRRNKGCPFMYKEAPKPKGRKRVGQQKSKRYGVRG